MAWTILYRVGHYNDSRTESYHDSHKDVADERFTTLVNRPDVEEVFLIKGYIDSQKR